MTEQSIMTEIASKSLGDSTSYAVYTDQYDPSLLNPMPRSIARSENDISGDEFIGFDVWHCYESTFLTDKGHPVSGVLKIVYPSNTKMMVESKSMKLFLNSFDMCKMGDNVALAIKNYENAVRKSLSDCLDDFRVEVKFFRHLDVVNKDLLVENKLVSDASMFDILNYDEDEDINLIYENPNQNYVTTIDENINIHLMFESLRSRCRHTKQKDTGTAITIMKNANIEPLSIYKQINSMRETNEFHEFCSEKLFTEIVKESKFSDIVIALLYTRRGSLDINPIRYNKDISESTFIKYVAPFIDVNVLTEPTLIQ